MRRKDVQRREPDHQPPPVWIDYCAQGLLFDFSALETRKPLVGGLNRPLCTVYYSI